MDDLPRIYYAELPVNTGIERFRVALLNPQDLGRPRLAVSLEQPFVCPLLFIR